MVGSLAFGALVASTSSAQAQDQLNFTGTADLADAPGSGGSQLFIDFLGDGDGAIFATQTISGAFATTISPGDVGFIQDLTVDVGGVVGVPVNPFMTIGGFSFTLASAPSGNAFGPISLFDVGTGTTGTFGFRGTVTGGAYGDVGRAYQGVFSAQFSGQTPAEVFNQVNTGGTLPVSFSANVIVSQSVIPEPSTYLLLGTGLGALALVGLRRRSMQS